MRRVAILLLVAAVGAGAAVGWWAHPAWRRSRALAAVTASDPTAREAGWRWLLAPPDRPRTERLVGAINARLVDAHDAALLDAADALRTVRRWGWEHQPPDLMVRELDLRAVSSNEADHVLAARAMLGCPLSLEAAEVLPLVDRLLQSDSPNARRLALAAACGWLGRAGAHRLAELSLPGDDHDLRRMSILAQSWARSPAVSLPIEPGDPVDIVEAKLFFATRADPHDARAVLEALASWTTEPRPAFAAILRSSLDPRVSEALRGLADAGDATAVFIVHAESRNGQGRWSRAILDDPLAEPWRRRLAAWRTGDLSDRQRAAVLDDDPTEPSDRVYAAALVAERILPPPVANEQAARWMIDLDDDRKRAGVLLAALLGVHRGTVRRAYEREDTARVRTTQRLALFALGEPGGTADPLEFASRALGASRGEFNPDAALCLLLAGHVPVLERLTSHPPATAGIDWRESVQQRAWLIERFVPAWYEAVGRPIAADVRSVHLHFDALCALRLLTQRRLRFDRRYKQFVLDQGLGVRG